MWKDDGVEKRAREVLHETRCPLCPNVIGDEPYHILRNQQVVKRLAITTDATLVEAAEDMYIMLLHARCFENAKLVHGED